MLNWTNVEIEIKAKSENTALTNHILSSIKVKRLVEEQSEILLTLIVPNVIIKEICERDIALQIQNIFIKSHSKPLVIDYLIESTQFSFPIYDDSLPSNDESKLILCNPKPEAKFEFKSKYSLNPKMKLSHLMVTAENEFSVKALCHFAEDAGVHSNCSSIFGNSGSGKTHLLHAIGWQFLKNNPTLKIKVISGDEFINDFQTAIFTKTMGEFRNKYRLKTDVLLIDDLQAIERAKGTQGELFNLLNDFSQIGKKIIITSDKQMSELGFDDRLKSRFSGGMVLNLELPSLESKKMFLDLRLQELNLYLDQEMVQTVFENLGPCYRSIEGAVGRLQMLQKINGSIQKDAVYKMFPKIDKKLTKELSIESVILNVAVKHKLKKSDLVGPSRKREVFEARKEAIKNIRDNFDVSLKEIGRIFNRDHSSILNALKVEEL